MLNFLLQNYTGPFAFDKNLLPRALGASKALDEFRDHVSVWKKFVSKLLNKLLKASQVPIIDASYTVPTYLLLLL